MRSNDTKLDVVGFFVQTEITKQSPSAFSAATTHSRNHDPNRFCTHCNRKRHELSECFIVHGYPDWFHEQKQQQQSTPMSNLRGRGGHFNGRGRGCGNVSRLGLVNPTANAASTASLDQISALISLRQNQYYLPIVCLDRFTRTLIGVGEEREGVYYFTGVSVARAHNTVKGKPSYSVLWHRRLGHPAYKVSSLLPVFDSFKVISCWF